MTIPPLPGQEVKEERRSLAPERKKVVTRPLRLGTLGLAAPLLLLAVGATAFFLLKEVEIRNEEDRREGEEGPMTFDKLRKENHRSPFPLAIGYEWKLGGAGEATEERRVISSHLAPTAEPQFEYTLTDPEGSTRMLLRATNEGVFLLEEKTIAGDLVGYDPPLLVVPRPIYIESTWGYTGTVTRGIEKEKWDLTFAVEKVESITTPVGTFGCLRVLVSGLRGDTTTEETIWYNLGTGPIQSRKKIGGRETTFTLAELRRPR